MFCKNCGTKLDNNATVCSSCGEQCTPGRAKMQPNPLNNAPKLKTEGRSLQFYISLAVSALTIIIFFTKWINIGALSMLGIAASAGGLSVYGSLRSLLSIVKILDGYPSIGGIWFMIALLFSLFLIPVLHGIYGYRLLKVETEGTKKIGSVISAFTFFLTLIFVVSLFIINSSISADLGAGYWGYSVDFFGFEASPFIIIVLSIINNRIISKIRFPNSQTTDVIEDSALSAK
jgi:hypothetical protein